MHRITTLFLFSVMAASCLQSKPALRLDQPTPVALVLVRDDVHEKIAHAVPDSMVERLKSELSERNLVPRLLQTEGFAERFSTLRDSRRRLQHLASKTDGLLVLIETQPVFYSQLSGRYRWTVYVKISISEAGNKNGPMVQIFDLPAVLTYDHEREAEALQAVSSSVASKLGQVMDAYLEGRSAPSADPKVEKTSARPQDPESIYFILVDRFHNGDPKNDGQVDRSDPAAWHGGDLQGVIDKLDYLQSMGFSTLWLSPVFATRQETFHGHGAFHAYWTHDQGAVEARFGDLALLRRLSDDLHRRGMQLVLDLVVNHVGYDAPLLTQQPAWFHGRGTITDWSDPEQVVNNDVHGLPDLAQENPQVYRHLLDAARTWLRDTRADGFRLDAVKHVSLAFWKRFNRELSSVRPGVILLGEHYDGKPQSVERVQRQGRFSHMFDFPLAFALKDVFCAGHSPGKLGAVLSDDRYYSNPHKLVTFLDNHDLPRIRSACEGDLEKVRQALTAQFAMRGVPALAYGTEAGLSGATEPENRADMIFDAQATRRLKDHVSTLLGLRRSLPALVSGKTRLLALDGRVLSLARVLPTGAVLIYINGGSKSVRIAPPALGQAQLLDAFSGRELEGELSVSAGQTRLVLIRPESPEDLKSLLSPANTRRKVRISAPAPDLARDARLTLVGSGAELGAWDPEKGVQLEREGGGTWTATLELPVGLVFAFKLVARVADGPTRWERHPDRFLFVEPGPEVIDLQLKPEFPAPEV